MFDHAGFYEIKQRVVHFRVEDPLSSAAGLHDLFLQCQAEHSDEAVFDLFSFVRGAVGEEV